MSLVDLAVTPHPLSSPGSNPPAADQSYRPGVCNIGPAEIRRRRWGAILGTVVTLVVAVVIFALGLPHPVRFLIALPAAGAIVSWLQVLLRFCVGFARLGVFNFGQLGPMEPVGDRAAHRADVRRATRMIALSLVGGLAIGIVAALLP
jgi:hypothetical protein